MYDIQYPDREEPNDRGKILANPDGTFNYRGILPTAYPIVGLFHMLGYKHLTPCDLSQAMVLQVTC